MDLGTAVRQHRIPEAIRSLDVLPSDYVDVFTATASHASDTSPEEWARVALERASPAGRFVAWRVLLQLRLEPSPDHVAGWKVADRGNGWIRLEASSWFMTANIIFQLDGDQVSFATLIRYDRGIARIVWTPVSVIHRKLAPDVLRAAVKRIDRRRIA
jgi:hypothetical protein